MSSLPFPIPTSLPFDLCAPTPNGTNVCVQMGGIIDKFGQPRDCQDGETPPLVSADMKYQEKTIDFSGDSEIKVENKIWLGVETDLEAVWVGEDKSQSCARFRLSNINPTAAIDTVVNKSMDTSRDIVRWLGMNPNGVLGGIVVVGIAIGIGLLFDGVPAPY